LGCGVVLLLLLGLVLGVLLLLLLLGVPELSLLPLVPDVPDDGAGVAGGVAGAAGVALLSAGAGVVPGVADGVGVVAFSSVGLWQPPSKAANMAAPAIALMLLLVAFMIVSFRVDSSYAGCHTACRYLPFRLQCSTPRRQSLNPTRGRRYVRCLTEWG